MNMKWAGKIALIAGLLPGMVGCAAKHSPAYHYDLSEKHLYPQTADLKESMSVIYEPLQDTPEYLLPNYNFWAIGPKNPYHPFTQANFPENGDQR